MKHRTLCFSLVVIHGLAVMTGCVAQRWNDHTIAKDGTVHDRAWLDLDIYGPLGKRTVGTLNVGDTATTSHVDITEQSSENNMDLTKLLQILAQLRQIAPDLPPKQ